MMNMMQNCSISEKEEVEDSQGWDLLSDLPLGIIHTILSHIPIREAVRTSVLSTQWRYTWTTLPQLYFGYDFLIQQDKAASRYDDFITQVLFHHKGPIHKFHMECIDDLRNIDDWILCLSSNDIRELILDIDPEDIDSVLKMQSSIYSCQKLTYLRLFGCELDPPPLNFKGFLFLRFLSLGRIILSSGEICSLVAVCPLLESFELLETKEYLELKISAPNLKHMHVLGGHRKLCINAPLLTELSLDLRDYNKQGSYQQLRSSACDYAKSIGVFTNLQKLIGTRYFTLYLSLGIELTHRLLVFHHLELIDLDEVNFEDVYEMQVVAYLVIGAPNLQVLKISAHYNSKKDDVSDSEVKVLSFRNLECPSNFKLEKLTDVSLIRANCFAMDVEFLKFLLEVSPALETMGVKLLDDSEEKWNNMRAELEGCNWASPTVKLCVWQETSYDTHQVVFPRYWR